MRTYRIPPDQEGRRLDRLIREWWPEVNMGLRMGAIRRGQVRLDGRRVPCSQRLLEGQELTVPWDQEPRRSGSGTPCPAEGRELPRWVIHWDRRLLVANKPAGWICQPGGGRGTSLPQEVWRLLGVDRGPVPSHRLDVNTTGVVLVPLDGALGRELHRLFREGTIRKLYWALVRGTCVGEALVDLPLSKDGRGNVTPSPSGQPARSVVRPLAVRGGFSLVEVELLTGRQHQARVHLAHLGLPILGDVRYGVRFRGVGRTMLHARRVLLPFGESLGDLAGAAFEAPLYPDMAEAARRLGLGDFT